MPARRKRPISVAITGPDKAGMYHAFLTVGVKPNGRPDRKHRMGRSADEVEEKIRALEDGLAAGVKPAPGRPITVEAWLRHWVEVIVSQKKRKYATLTVYRTNVYRHLIPELGGFRLDVLAPEDVEAAMARLAETPVRGKVRSEATVHQAYRVLRTALNAAVKHGRIDANPATRADAPPAGDSDVEPLTVAEARRLIEATQSRVRGARWALALSLGLRQGECLALTWDDVDLKKGTLTIQRNAYRRRLEHGCDDPHACGYRRGQVNAAGQPVPTAHRLEPCPPSWGHGCEVPCGKKNPRFCPNRAPVPCRRHARGCPPLCGPDCVGHARTCPQRKGGIEYDDPKTAKSRRIVNLPEPLVKALRRHRQQQAQDRLRAGSKWQTTNLVFAGPLGEPLDSRRDWADWKDLLRAAGLKPARVHAARHTAATLLLVQGVDRRVVMGLLGWSNESMLKRYQHVVAELREEAAKRVGVLLWGDSSSSASSNAKGI